MAKKSTELSLNEKMEQALVPEEEQPYEVPENWCWTTIGNVLTVSSGKGLTAQQMNNDGNIPVYGGNGINGFHDNYIVDGENIVIGRVGAYCGCVHFVIGRAWITDNALITAFNRKYIDTRFLYWLLTSTNLRENDSSSAQPVISGTKIYGLPIPLPPLTEQKRIVEHIENLFVMLDNAKDILEKVIDAYSKRRNSIISNALTGKYTSKWRKQNKSEVCLKRIIEEREKSPVSKELKEYINKIENGSDCDDNGWHHLKLMLLCDNITCGGTPTGNLYEEGEIPFLKVYNIVSNHIDFVHKPQFTDRNIQDGELRSSQLKPNDVVMNIVGPPLRKIAIIPEDYPEWNMNQAIVRFRTIKFVEPKFLYYTLLYPKTLDEVIRATKGVVGQANISITQSRNLEIPVPTLEEQYLIINILDDILIKEENAVNLYDLVDEIDYLKKTILAKAFRGELNTNNQSEEKAIKLIERILQEVK